MNWDQVLASVLPLGGAAIGYVAATKTTSRQIEHARQQQERHRKREVLEAFNSSVLRWADGLVALIGTREHAPHRYESEFDRYDETWKSMMDAYSRLLLTASDSLMERLRDVFVPARDRAVAAGSASDEDSFKGAFEASKGLRNAVGELLNDFRAEIGEPPLATIEAAAAIARGESDNRNGSPNQSEVPGARF